MSQARSLNAGPSRLLVRRIELPSPRAHAKMLSALIVVALAPIAGLLVSTSTTLGTLLMLLGLLSAGVSTRAGQYSLVVGYCVLTGLHNELSDQYYSTPFSVAGNSFQYLDILLVVSIGVCWLWPNHSSWSEGGTLWLLLFVGWTICIGIMRSISSGVEYHVWIREARTVAWFVFAITLSRLLTNKRRVITAAYVLLLTSVGIAVMAASVRIFHTSFTPMVNLLSYQPYGVRIFQVEGVERATYAIALALGFILVRGPIWLWLVVAANMVTLIVGLTRGAYLATVAAAVIMLAALGLQKLPRLLATTLGLVAMVVFAVGFLNLSTSEDVSTGFLDRVAAIDQLESQSGNVGTRLTEWDVVWSFLTRNPDSLVVGLGLGGTFEDPYNILQSDGSEAKLGSLRFSYVHNGFIWYVLRGGIVGMVLLYGFCVWLVYRCLLLARRVLDAQLRSVFLGVAGVYVAVLVLSWSGSPLSEGMRMSVLMAYAALGLAAIRLAEGRGVHDVPRRASLSPS
jgi:O-antigen ligase